MLQEHILMEHKFGPKSHRSRVIPLRVGFRVQPHVKMLFWDFGLDVWSRTMWSWTNNSLEEYLKLNMLQDHIWKAYCSRSIQQTCSWSSVHFKYGPGVYLTWIFFFRVLMVQEHMVLDHVVLDHKSRPKYSKNLSELPNCSKSEYFDSVWTMQLVQTSLVLVQWSWYFCSSVCTCPVGLLHFTLSNSALVCPCLHVFTLLCKGRLHFTSCAPCRCPTIFLVLPMYFLDGE